MSIARAVARGLGEKYPSYEDLTESFLEFLEEEEYDDEILEGDIEDPDGEICDFLVENTDIDREEASESLIYIYQNRHLYATPEPPNDTTFAPSSETSDAMQIESNDDYDDDDESEEYDNTEQREVSPNNAEPHRDDTCIHVQLQQPEEIKEASPASSQSNMSEASSSAPEAVEEDIEQKSAESSSAFTAYLFDLTEQDLEEKKQEAIQLLNEHCPFIVNNNHNSDNLIFIMMMCCITNKPFTSWIMDSFDRFKIEYCLNNKLDCSCIDPLYFSQLCPNFGEYLTELEDTNDLDFNSIIPNAMHEYNKHILHGMDFKPKYKIHDDYYEYVTNIFGVNQAVQKLLCYNPNNQDIDDNDDHDSDAIYPFQLDVWIIPSKVERCGDNHKADDDDEEEKDIDDIEGALLECEYGEEYYENEEMELDEEEDDDEDIPIFNRDKHTKMVNWIKRAFQNDIEIEKNNRYVLVIDRSAKPEDNSAYCLLHVHEDTINEDIAGYFDEPFFERSKRFAFVNESDPEHPWSLYEDHRHIFCVSYHILSRKSVKMYWNVGDQKTRFKMNDLWNIWPMYFDESCYDESFIDEMKRLPNNQDLPDQEFDDFYQCITKTKKIDIDHLKHIVSKTEMIQQKQVNVMNYDDDDSDDEVEIGQKMELQDVDDGHKITDIQSKSFSMNTSSRKQDIDDDEEEEEDEDYDEDEDEDDEEEEIESEQPEDDEDEHKEPSSASSHDICSTSQTSSVAYNSTVQQQFDSSQASFNNDKHDNHIHDDSSDDDDQDQDESDKKYQNDHQYEQEEQSKMTKMMLWLKQRPLNTQYLSHFNAFETAIKKEFDDDSDFDIDNVLDELNYFKEGDVEGSELLIAIKESEDCEKGFDRYIPELIEQLKEYTEQKSSSPLIMNVSLKNAQKEKYQDTDYDHSHCAEIKDVAIEYGGGGNIKQFYKVSDKHFLYYCCGECVKNHFARYIFNDITKEQKQEILSDYFWSFDYELRQNLITILTENYDLKQSQDLNNLLSELNQPNVFIADNDKKWIEIFDKILNENNGDILLQLSQISCQKGPNFPLIKELRDNNTTFSNNRNHIRELQEGINKIRKNSIKFNIHLTNDEMSVLYLIANDAKFNILSSIQNQDRFPNKQRSCKWKSFHLNLLSVIDKLKKHRYRFGIPNDLFCSAQNINDSNDLNLYMNQITVWHSNQLQQSNKNTILHLKDLKQQQNLENNIQIIPFEWILNNKNENKLFLVLPLRIHQISAVSTTSIHQYTIPRRANYQSIHIITL